MSILRLLFVCSGAAGLIYQVIWARQLGLVFGNTLQSAASTAAAFLLGLGLGAYLAGRWSPPHPGRAFAAMELVVALTGLAVTLGISKITPLASALASSHPDLLTVARFVLAFLLLLIPCTAMGATLPLLVEHLDEGRFASTLGALYALNTLGAALGAWGADFVLAPRLGVIGTALAASGLDLLVGLLALLLTRKAEAVERQVRPARVPIRIPGQLVALLYLTGFASLALEILYVRMMVFFNGHDIYAFSTVLGCYLVGLVLGGLWVARRGAGQDLGTYYLLLAAATLASLFLAALATPLRNVLARSWPGVPFDLVRLGTCALIMLPATSLLGASFPLLNDHVRRLQADGSRAEVVGQSFLVNTLGTLSGSLAAGFVLIPWLGMQRSVVFVAALFCLAAILYRPGLKPGLAGLLIVTAGVATPGEFLKQVLFRQDYPGIRFYQEDRYATVAMIEQLNPLEARPNLNLIVDGFNMMGASLEARRYATMLALIPSLCHPQPEDQLVICFGLANTVSTAVELDETRRVECVELTPTVVRASASLLPYVQKTLASPKLHLTYTDGRNYLAVTRRSFDVITAEPPPPIHAGVVNLYSREYFQACRNRLKPGGLVCHWLPVNQISPFEARTIIRACQDVFPYTSLWEGGGLNLCLLGSEQPFELSYERVEACFRKHGQFLAERGLDGPEFFPAAWLRGPDELRRYTAETPPLTDNRPYIQYYQGDWQPDVVFFFVDTGQPPMKRSPAAVFRAFQAMTTLRLYLYGKAREPDLNRFVRAELASRLLREYPGSTYFQVVLGCSEEMEKKLEQSDDVLELARVKICRGQLAEGRALLAGKTSPLAVALTGLSFRLEGQKQRADELFDRVPANTGLGSYVRGLE
ncbi:hypothetical protein DYH09_19830 [bacterium CPR1]|nr:hypothetical protein [bacterium CPR1]